MTKPRAASDRTRLKRHPERAKSERTDLYDAVDHAWICHVGVLVDGVPVVIPTMHARIDDTLYLHGARQNRQLLALLEDRVSCVTLCVLDGLVYAERAFSHSMNYRSAVVFARGVEVCELTEKRAVLHALVERFGPGRAQEALAPSDAELAATLVVALPLAEASVKARDAGPSAREHSEVWTGVLPVHAHASLPAEGGASPAALHTVLAAQGHRPYDVEHGERSLSTRAELLDLAFVHRFLRDDSYWASGLDAQRFAQAIAGSLCFGMRLAGRQIGFARVVLDGARFAYLADVFVAKEERGKGHGKWLVEQVLAHPEVARVKRVLLGTRDAHALYARFGFRAVPDGVFMARDLPDSCAAP